MTQFKSFLVSNSESIKHAVDTALIPGGIAVGIGGWLDIINSGLTFLVLLTSLIWGIYRIKDMREKRKGKK